MLETKYPEPRILGHWLNEAEDYFKSFGNAPKLPMVTLSTLNQRLWGLHPGELHVMAARTSQGKSALTSQIALDLAEQGFQVVSFQLEMSIKEVVRRLACYKMRIDSVDILKGKFNTDEAVKQQWGIFKESTKNHKFYLSENFGKTWPEIIQKLEEIKITPQVVIIDHLHNIKSDPKNQRENINEYVRQFRALCVKRGIAGILCAQLNRAAMDKDNDMPFLTHLKESGYIEEAADVCMVLWWPWKSGKKWNKDGVSIEGIRYNPTEEEWKNFFIIDIAKNRNGACHKVALRFEPQYYCFSEWNKPEKVVSVNDIDWNNL